jgi:hypothetical protein
MSRYKRLSGGQPGNQNARKHGFYSAKLSEKELSEYWELVNIQRMDPQLAFTRVKVGHSVGNAPGNHRVLMEGTNLVAKVSGACLGLGSDDTSMVKNITRCLLETAVKGDLERPKQVASQFLKALENTQDE